MRRLQLSLTIGVVSATLIPATPANAAAVVAGPGNQYVTNETTTTRGGPLVFANGDVRPHNVIAFKHYLPRRKAKKAEWCTFYPKKKCPVFWSETIGPGAATEVQGLGNVRSGKRYRFYCSIHPGMRGVLVVQ